MTQGKHFAAGGDHFAALPSKKDSHSEGDRASDRHRGDHGRHDRIEPHLTVHGIRPDR